VLGDRRLREEERLASLLVLVFGDLTAVPALAKPRKLGISFVGVEIG
jgi:hypothetical protein